MKRCWVCGCDLKDYMLLPHQDEFFEGSIPIFKNTFIIKTVEPFTFMYYTCCNTCIDNYIMVRPNILNYLRNRELGKKKRR